MKKLKEKIQYKKKSIKMDLLTTLKIVSVAIHTFCSTSSYSKAEMVMVQHHIGKIYNNKTKY